MRVGSVERESRQIAQSVEVSVKLGGMVCDVGVREVTFGKSTEGRGTCREVEPQQVAACLLSNAEEGG